MRTGRSSPPPRNSRHNTHSGWTTAPAGLPHLSVFRRKFCRIARPPSETGATDRTTVSRRSRVSVSGKGSGGSRVRSGRHRRSACFRTQSRRGATAAPSEAEIRDRRHRGMPGDRGGGVPIQPSLALEGASGSAIGMRHGATPLHLSLADRRSLSTSCLRPRASIDWSNAPESPF